MQTTVKKSRELNSFLLCHKMHTNSRDVCALYPTMIKRNNLAKDLKIPFLRYRLNIYPHKRVIKSKFASTQKSAKSPVLLGTYSILYDPQLCAYRLLNVWINFDMIDGISNTIYFTLVGQSLLM